MKSIVVALVLVLICSFSYETKTNVKLTRKLFNTINREIDNLVNQQPNNNSSDEADDLEEDINHNNWIDESESDSLDSHLDLATETEAPKKPASEKSKLAATSTKKRRIRMKDLSYDREVLKTNVGYEDWLSIASVDFQHPNRYPTVEGNFLHLDGMNTRINDRYAKGNKITIPGENYFWFRQSLKYIYYADSKQSNNALGTIYIDNIKAVRDTKGDKKHPYCFNIFMQESVDYKICAQTFAIKKKWFCIIQKLIHKKPSGICIGQKFGDRKAEVHQAVKTKTVIQPMVLIPLPAKHCNEEWNYQKSNNHFKLLKLNLLIN